MKKIQARRMGNTETKHEFEHIPNTDSLKAKPDFEKRYRSLLGDEYDSFMECSLSFLRKSIRVNTLKTTPENIIQKLSPKWKLTPVPWCKEGFWLKSERRDVGNLTEHALGYIYVQEAASMIPPLVLDVQEGDIVLDLCAAPGSKSTQLAQYLNNTGALLCNDYLGDRLKALGMNLQRCGALNTIITQTKGHRFKELNFEFDKILVDAPCSGTGTIRKSLRTLRMWNPNMVKRLSGIQRELLKTAYGLLRNGGSLVYSTCTLEPEEDEGIISDFLDKNEDAKLAEIEFNGKRSKPVEEFDGRIYNAEVRKCLRLWPQDNDTEGFFVAKIIRD